ncbi:MAG TPA: hypothetical protein VJB66_00025 [Candidatus Nanoarchaeia archaeon]|nr:hypothetical protein [Candidatus Nanoarchaeia archaeon]
MSLVTYIKRLLCGSPVKEAAQTPPQTTSGMSTPVLDTLLAVIVPRTVLTEPSYKTGGIVPVGDISKYFDGCASDVAQAIYRVYGTYDSTKTNRDRTVVHAFTRADDNITYAIQGINDCEAATYRKGFSTDVTGALILQQPQIDLQKAGSLLRAVLESHLLDYRETAPLFGVFYTRSGEKSPTLEGIPLLKEMDVKPTEAAEFFSIMFYGGYRHKQFKEGELPWPA